MKLKKWYQMKCTIGMDPALVQGLLQCLHWTLIIVDSIDTFYRMYEIDKDRFYSWEANADQQQ